MRLGGQSHTFQLLFADDLKMVAAGEDKYDRRPHLVYASGMADAGYTI